MDIIEQLKRIRLLQNKVDATKEELQSLRDKAYTVQGQAPDDVRIQETKKIHPLEDLLCKIDLTEKKLDDRSWELVETRHNAIKAIFLLQDANEEDLLCRRYVWLEKWEDIAKNMGMGVRQCYKIRNKALKHLEETMAQEAAQSS